MLVDVGYYMYALALPVLLIFAIIGHACCVCVSSIKHCHAQSLSALVTSCKLSWR